MWTGLESWRARSEFLGMGRAGQELLEKGRPKGGPGEQKGWHWGPEDRED